MPDWNLLRLQKITTDHTNHIQFVYLNIMWKNKITKPYPKKLCAHLVNINEIAKKIIFDLGNLGGIKIYGHIYLFIYGFNYLPVSLQDLSFLPVQNKKETILVKVMHS